MRRDRHIRGALAAVLGATLVAACGDSISSDYADYLRAAYVEDRPPPPDPTREELNTYPYAVIAVRPEGAPNPFYVGATTDNDGYVSYYSGPAGRSFTMKGGAITGHRGLSFDLLSLDSSPDDPLMTPTPLADWPESVDRAYQMRDGAGKIYTRGVVCVPLRGAAVQLEIKEIVFDVVEVEDRCRSGDLAFSNRYWVAADTGFIWKSTQWTGPEMYPLTIEIIRPYARKSF